MLSVVIPVYNEEESLVTLHKEIRAVAAEQGYQMDIVFVDDGSSDGSWAEIARLSEVDPQVSGIRFRGNFGKAAALAAGFDAAKGELVFTLDADLQDDPAEMPRFLAELEAGHVDVVSGWKKTRHDPWHKVFPSRIFNGLVSWLTGVKLHDHNCGFKCYRREIFEEVRLYGELHRFVPVLAAARGWKVGELVVNHRARKFGKSKYGFRRFVKGFLDLLTVYFLTGFNHRPQHLLGTMGIISFMLGLGGLFYLAVYWVVKESLGMTDWADLHERPAMIYSMGAMLLGANFMSMGFLAELLTAHSGRENKPYSVKQTTDSPEQPSAIELAKSETHLENEQPSDSTSDTNQEADSSISSPPEE